MGEPKELLKEIGDLANSRGVSGFVWENMMSGETPSLARFSKSKITVSLARTIG